MKRKLFFAFLFFISLGLILPFNSFAQSTTSAETTTNTTATALPSTPSSAYPLNTDSNVPQDFHTYTQSVFIELLSTATCFIGGQDLLNPTQKCLGIDPTTKKIGYVQSNGGLLMAMGGLIGSTYNIPVSTSQYGRDLAANFGIVHSSYASGLGEGIGFVGLTPVLQIWKAFRNVTYLVFVLIFVLLGLGIMFRINIDARTIMTIQNQIPKIVIGLILITFSYAIAGLLVDLMYTSIYLIIHVFADQGLTTLTNIATNPVDAVGNIGGISAIASPAAKGAGGMISSLFDGTLGTVLATIATTVMGSFLGSSLGGGLLGGLIGGAIGLIGGLLFGSKIIGLIAMIIAYLVISIAILSALFRVWFMLIKAYIFIFLDVILGPFWILGGLLPGSPGGFGPWIRSLTANLAAFPVVITLFMIGKSIQDLATNSGGNFIPPLIGNPGSNSGEAIGSLVGLGIILIMPEAVTMTKGALKAPEMKYTAAIGRALNTGSGVISKPISSVKGELFGKDAFNNPRIGTKLIGKRFGSFMGGLTGGTFDNEGDKYGVGVGKFRIPHPLGNKVPGTDGKREKNWFGRDSKAAKEYKATQAREAEAARASESEADARAEAHKERLDSPLTVEPPEKPVTDPPPDDDIARPSSADDEDTPS